jgi:HEPN domain-containing protein
MKTDFLKKRAEEFLKDAEYDLSQEHYSLAAFHLEQSLQLLLKYYLFRKLKDFPKIHSLTQLLKEVGKTYQKEKMVEELIQKNINLIADLEQAYLSSRYLPVEFYKEQVENMKVFTDNLIEFLKKL